MTLTAVLLAGGLSRRMGVDKATLDCGGTLLWRRQVELLVELQPVTIWIAALQRPAWCPAEMTVVIDETPPCGPLSGLAAAFARMETSHLLALAVDLPGMRGEHLRKLWSMAEPGCGVISRIGDTFEPLCAVYPAEAAASVRDVLRGGGGSLQKLAARLEGERRLRVYLPDAGEQSLYHNVNTPEDWVGPGN